MILHIAGKVHFYFKLSLPIIRSNGVLTMRQQGSNSNPRGSRRSTYGMQNEPVNFTLWV